MMKNGYRTTRPGTLREDWTYSGVWHAWTRGEARIYPDQYGDYAVSVNSIWEPGVFREWEDAVKKVQEIEGTPT